jgi:hypothetical protein
METSCVQPDTSEFEMALRSDDPGGILAVAKTLAHGLHRLPD